jgi:hypothetical protein
MTLVVLQAHIRAQLDDMDLNTPTPSVGPPQLSQLQDKSCPSNSPEFYPPRVFTGTPLPSTTLIAGLPADTAMAGRVSTTEWLAAHRETWEGVNQAFLGNPPYLIKMGPPKKKALPENMELSVFDILNIFHCHWFLSWDHLRAQALLAQKAKDGNLTWVEFTAQFHAHLVKCAIVLVPWLIQKVKKVMFGFILELLNGEGPQAFFDLLKGNRQATTAQMEKKHLACKRNHTLRCDCCRLAEEATEGHPQWQCDGCRHKFASCKAVKRHWCPNAKGASRGVVVNLDEGKSIIKPTLNKPATIPPLFPHHHLCHLPLLAYKRQKRRDPEPHPLLRMLPWHFILGTQWTEHFTQVPLLLGPLPPD